MPTGSISITSASVSAWSISPAMLNARQCLHLEVAQRLLLLLREIAHLRLGEPDVIEIALAHLRDRALDLREQKDVGLERREAALAHVVEGADRREAIFSAWCRR